MVETRTRDRYTTAARLLKAVETLLTREGFSGLGVNAVAREAGIDKVLIYRYFDGMPGLLRAFAHSDAFWPTVEEILGEGSSDLSRMPVADRWSTGLVRYARALRRSFLRTFNQVAASARGLLTLVTPTNTMSDWINTGRVYVRAQLTADALGLRFQPVSQSLQEFPEMDKLRAKMDELVGVTAPAKLQMLIRLGRSRPPALSPRRELGRFIRR